MTDTNKKIALCYVRKTKTDGSYTYSSPEVQRAHLQAVCDENDWIPEWYEEVQSHLDAINEINRPTWTRLMARLGDSNIVAIVIDDLSLVHSKGYNFYSTLKALSQFSSKLVFADPPRQLDFSVPIEQLMNDLHDMLMEWYAYTKQKTALASKS
jgi:hypothetical protein